MGIKINKLAEEEYFKRFQKYVVQSGDKELEEAMNVLCDLKILNEECDLKKETLSKKEKRKKESEKRSHSKKRNWSVTQDTEKLKKPAGYKELQSLSRGVTEKKKRKPACTKKGEKGHNYYHNSKGEFSSKEDATSWSNDVDFYGASRNDCVGGKFKSDGKGRKLFTKNKCGAKKDGGKHPHKCKGDKVKESLVVTPNDLKNFPTAVLVEELLNRLDEGMSNNDILKLCAAINSSADGYWPPKKQG